MEGYNKILICFRLFNMHIRSPVDINAELSFYVILYRCVRNKHKLLKQPAYIAQIFAF